MKYKPRKPSEQRSPRPRTARAVAAARREILSSPALAIRSQSDLPIGLGWGRMLQVTSSIDFAFRGAMITVPKGFVFDGASVPRPLWWILGFDPRDFPVQMAAALHDWGYQTQHLDRVIIDAMFMSALVRLGVPWWRAKAMHVGVRLFGGAAWRRWRAELSHAARDAVYDQHGRRECD